MDDKELDVFTLPDIFRAIGPGDDVVVNAEKLRAYLKDQKHDLLNRVEEAVSRSTSNWGNGKDLCNPDTLRIELNGLKEKL